MTYILYQKEKKEDRSNT